MQDRRRSKHRKRPFVGIGNEWNTIVMQDCGCRFRQFELRRLVSRQLAGSDNRTLREKLLKEGLLRNSVPIPLRLWRQCTVDLAVLQKHS